MWSRVLCPADVSRPLDSLIPNHKHGAKAMKCIKELTTNKVTRVDNDVADRKVTAKTHVYTHKTAWRATDPEHEARSKHQADRYGSRQQRDHKTT